MGKKQLQKQRCASEIIDKAHQNRSTNAVKVRENVNGKCALIIDMCCVVHCAYRLHSQCHKWLCKPYLQEVHIAYVRLHQRKLTCELLKNKACIKKVTFTLRTRLNNLQNIRWTRSDHIITDHKILSMLQNLSVRKILEGVFCIDNTYAGDSCSWVLFFLMPCNQYEFTNSNASLAQWRWVIQRWGTSSSNKLF